MDGQVRHVTAQCAADVSISARRSAAASLDSLCTSSPLLKQMWSIQTVKLTRDSCTSSAQTPAQPASRRRRSASSHEMLRAIPLNNVCELCAVCMCLRLLIGLKQPYKFWFFLLLLCQSNFYNLKHCLFEAVLSPDIFVSIPFLWWARINILELSIATLHLRCQLDKTAWLLLSCFSGTVRDIQALLSCMVTAISYCINVLVNLSSTSPVCDPSVYLSLIGSFCTDRWLVVPCGSLIQHLIKNSSMSGIILKKISFSWICLRYFDSFNLVLLRVSVSRFCTFLASAVRVQCFARLRKVHNNRFAD